jgi:hypothetical protein
MNAEGMDKNLRNQCGVQSAASAGIDGNPADKFFPQIFAD